MIKASISVQDLRRRIYLKAKAEPAWRFWGLYVHVCKQETLREAYKLAKENDGAPGMDGVSFEAIEESGVDGFLEQIREELVTGAYRPLRNRKVEIPKSGGKFRTISIPTIRDRVVQGALKLIVEPIFEADFQEGSSGYRPKRSAHQAMKRVERAIVAGKTRVIDIDLRSYFDTVNHQVLMGKIARRINDPRVMRLLAMILKASGSKGVPQGGIISPVLSNLYLTEVDRMLEKAKEVTRNGDFTHIEYARFADDIVILIDGHRRHDWLMKAVEQRLREELTKLQVEVNEEKSRIVDLEEGESFGFVGFDIQRVRSRNGKWRAHSTPKMKKRVEVLEKVKNAIRNNRFQPVRVVVKEINAILSGWVNYFRQGNSARCFSYVRDRVERMIRRHLMRIRNRRGVGWKRWSRQWLYEELGMFNDYQIRRTTGEPKALPSR